MTDNWYSYNIKQIEEKLNTDINTGLSRKAADSRRRRGGANVIYDTSDRGFIERVKGIFFDYINILFIIVVIIAALMERDAAYLYMLLLLAVNNVTVTAVYYKAYSVLGGVERHSLPFARVMREGRLFVKRQEQLVKGDIIFVSEGDIVPCDARLVETDRLRVLENNLLETDGITQKDAKFIEYKTIPPEQQKNMIFASTVVTGGSGKAIVCETGKNTLVCSLKKNRLFNAHGKLGIVATFEKYCRGLGLFMIALIFVLSFIDLVMQNRGMGLFNTFLTGLSLSVSSMSSMFVLFGYLIVGCGIFSAIHKSGNISSGALIKNPSKLDKLKDLSCLIVHREGVLSLKNIRVEKIFMNGRLYSSDDKKTASACGRLIRYGVVATGKYGANIVADSDGNKPSSPIDDAIISLADKMHIYNMNLDREFPITDRAVPSADSRFDTTLTYHGGKYLVILKGEWEQVLSRCRSCRYNNAVFPMTSEIADNIKLTAYQLSDEAYRIVGIASKDFAFRTLDRIRSAQSDLTFEGFMAIREPLLTDVAKQISKCRAAGIRTLMVTDDTSASNLSFARTVGIAGEESEVITGTRILRMGEKDFSEKVSEYSIFEDLSISQRRMLIKSLQAKGERVGVIGSTLAESLLVKEADVGFAQSIMLDSKENRTGVDLAVPGRNAGGCDALKFVSDVIVSDASEDGCGGFNAMVGSVESAKVIYQNILRTVRYLMVSQFARFFTVLYAVITGSKVFLPMQILFCGLIVDLAAVIIIAFEKPSLDELSVKTDTEKILRRPFIKYWHTLLIGLIWTALTIAVPYAFAFTGMPLGSEEMATYVFFSFIFTQVINLNETMKERSIFVMNIKLNRVYILVIAILTVFIALYAKVPAFVNIFSLSPLSLQGWICSFSIPLLMLGVFEIYKLILIFVKPKNRL